MSQQVSWQVSWSLQIISSLNYKKKLVHSCYTCFYIYISFSHQDISIDLSRIERTLQKIKKGALPKTPKTVKEIVDAFKKAEVIDSYGSTLQTVDLDGNLLPEKHRFFDTAFECKEYAYCIFTSKQTVELIENNLKAKNRHVLMDATFRVTPVGPFKQLLILYIRKHKKVIIKNFISLFSALF